MGLIFLFHSEGIKKSDIAHDLFCLLSFIFFVIKYKGEMVGGS